MRWRRQNMSREKERKLSSFYFLTNPPLPPYTRPVNTRRLLLRRWHRDARSSDSGQNKRPFGAGRNADRTASTSSRSQSSRPFPRSAFDQWKQQSWRVSVRYAIIVGVVLWGAESAYDRLFPTIGNDSFVAYKLVNKEKVSSTASILTLDPQDVSGHSDTFKDAWKRGIWNFQFKQPEIQIVRPYTPLPPLEGNGEDNLKTEALRFLIRKEQDGEMSSYLHCLSIGSQVEARGPYIEYELPRNVNRILFLAAGTGIAPALQTAHAFLNSIDDPKHRRLHIVWANRKREDCRGGDKMGSTTPTTISEADQAQQGVVVRQLNYLQQKHPGQITVDYLVDEENSVLDAKLLAKSLAVFDQALSPKDEKDDDQNLILVSGPDGFIKHIAGPKIWLNGRDEQGEVGGLLSQEVAKRAEDWNVWKI